MFIRIPESVLAPSSVSEPIEYDNYQVIKDQRKETKYSIAPSVSGTKQDQKDLLNVTLYGAMKFY